MEQKQKDQHQGYVQEVARLTRKCIQLETDKSFLESDFNALQEKFRILVLRKEPPPLPKEHEDCIKIAKHTEVVEKVEQELKELRHQSKEDITNLVKRVQDLEFERQYLVMQHSDSNSKMISMQSEVENVLNKQKTWQKNSRVLEGQLIASQGKILDLSKQGCLKCST
ncbi:centrosomal protein of 89 kDa-like [Symsagittifera roscoffensis]|uniref:centrosomal protein of 89 kDa-like n=1 Tax=Symsagittifera roscoffensis TaxID=84072 RepID=UPI00307C0AE1